MNERIKTLFKQAGGYIETDDKGNYFTYTQDFDPEVFANLIVKDCVGIVENVSPGYNDYRNQIEDAFRGDCVLVLKDSFGITNEI